MRKLLPLLLIVGFVLLATSPAFAQARYGIQTSRPIETTGIAVDQDGNTMDYAVYVYGLSIFADATNSFLGTYDCDTTAELNSTSEYSKDEIGEATQYDTAIKMYDTPQYYSDGVGVIMTTGVGYIHYGPQP